MRVAVIDIGSNSIKALVAERGPGGRPVEVASRTIEARISAGIGSGRRMLGAEGMARGLAAVSELAALARGAGAARIVAVATSAVRDASNGGAFTAQVAQACGVDVRILSGTEEANLIGRGLATDPSIGSLADFDVFDLGGGSLECLRFGGGRMEAAISLQLGCVRLTERCVADRDAPLDGETRIAIERLVERELRASTFSFPLPGGADAVGTGGTLTTARAIEAARRGVGIDQVDPLVRVSDLEALLARVGGMRLDGRRAVPGLSQARADVFPTALVTLITVARVGDFGAFRHSLRNLRWGVAAELLGWEAGGRGPTAPAGS